MKVKHWIIYELVFMCLVIFELYNSAQHHLTISQGGLPKSILLFSLGTVTTAIAFLWAEWDK